MRQSLDHSSIHVGLLKADDAIATSSKSLICNVAEKTILNVSPEMFVTMWTKLVPDTIMAVDTVAETLQEKLRLYPDQVKVDLQALLSMGNLMQQKLDKAKPTSELKLQAMNLKQVERKMSPRISAHFQSTSRSSFNNAKTVWEYVVTFFPSGRIPDATEFTQSMSEHLAKLKAITKAMEDIVGTRSGDEDGGKQLAAQLFDYSVDMFNQDGDAVLKKFCDCMGLDESLQGEVQQ